MPFSCAASPNDIFHVHLCNLYTGAPHSPAPNPAVLTLRPVGNQSSYSISISGDYLGVYMLSTNGIANEVVIWNWKTGVCKLVSPRPCVGVNLER